MLWNRSLVIRDLETGSLWSHILGRCMAGELEGMELPFVPGTVVTWKDWYAEHPETTVLKMSRTASEYQRFALSDSGRYVFGVKVGQEVKAYTYRYLAENPIVHDEIAETPVLIAFDAESGRAFMFDRTVDGAVLNFGDSYNADGSLVALGTRELWNPWSGRPITASKTGHLMVPLYGIISYRQAWEVFYPGTEIVGLETEQ